MCVQEQKGLLQKCVFIFKPAKYIKWRKHCIQCHFDLKINTTAKLQVKEHPRLLKFTSSSTFIMSANRKKQMKQLLQNKVGHERFIETNSTQLGCTESFFFLNLKLLIKFSKCSFKFLVTLCEVFIPLGEKIKIVSFLSCEFDCRIIWVCFVHLFFC